MTFDEWFAAFDPAGRQPHAWQRELASDQQARSRLIRVPTSMGKTLGALAAWSWNRLGRSDDTWPRRLVWCLRIRVLVAAAVQLRPARDGRGESRGSSSSEGVLARIFTIFYGGSGRRHYEAQHKHDLLPAPLPSRTAINRGSLRPGTHCSPRICSHPPPATTLPCRCMRRQARVWRRETLLVHEPAWMGKTQAASFADVGQEARTGPRNQPGSALGSGRRAVVLTPHR